MTRATLFVVLLFTILAPLAVLAQTSDDLKNDEKTPDNVLVYGMGYSGNRFSPLTQINKEQCQQTGACMVIFPGRPPGRRELSHCQ